MNSKKKGKRMLIGSCIMAALIVGASTFAWFSSTDDVTNRLTATGNYGIAVAEEFTPPGNIVPGEEITKKVMATNTGNIGGLVRMAVDNSISGKIIGSAGTFVAGNANSYVRVGDYDLDGNVNQSSDDSFTNEMKELMSGGHLVYAPGNCTFTDGTNSVSVDITNLTTEASASVTSGWLLASGAPEGYYIFARKTDASTTEYTGFYYKDGSYYRLEMQDARNSNNTRTSHIVTSTLTIDDTSKKITSITTPLVTLRDLEATDKVYTVLHSTTGTAADDEILVIVDVNGDDDDTDLNTVLTGTPTDLPGNTANDLIFHLKLTEALTETSNGSKVWTSTHWTAIPSNTDKPAVISTNMNDGLCWVYYNDKLEPGETTPTFVESVTFDSRCSGGYAAFTYDIDVILQSVQVVYDSANNEIAPGGAIVGNNKQSAASQPNGWEGVTATVTDDNTSNGKITSVAWSKN